MHKVIVNDTWLSIGWMNGEGATTLWEGYKESASDIHHFMDAYDSFFNFAWDNRYNEKLDNMSAYFRNIYDSSRIPLRLSLKSDFFYSILSMYYDQGQSDK